MRISGNIRAASSTIVRAMLLTVALTAVAGTSHAGMGEARGSGGGERAYGRDGGHARSRGGERNYRGGRGYDGGGRTYGGRVYSGGGYGNAGGGSWYGGSGYFGNVVRVPSGGGCYDYGASDRYYNRSRYRRPQASIRFSIGRGRSDCYYPPARAYSVRREPVYGNRVEIEVTNESPDGCYYYDSFCNERFSTLDDYSDHLQDHHHAQNLCVVNEESGDILRTLIFVDGYWQVRQ